MKLPSDRECRVFRANIEGPARLSRAVERVAARHEAGDSGVILPVRPGNDDDYPRELDARLGDLEPQFFLRNVPRAEHYLDDELRLEYVSLGDEDEIEDAHVAALTPLERPELLDRTSAQRLVAHRSEMRRLFFEADWSRHFGHELKTKLSERRRAVWSYDPDKETLE